MKEKSTALIFLLALAHTIPLIGQKVIPNWGLLSAEKPLTKVTSAPTDSNITIVSRYSHGYAGTIVVKGNYAYMGTSIAFLVFDISNPTKPELVKDLYLLEGMRIHVLRDSLAYGIGGVGLKIINVSDPTHPVEVGHFGKKGSFYYTVAVYGHYAYLAAGKDGLRIVDISNPSSPKEVGYYKKIQPLDIQVSGHYAYVTDLEEGLYILDLSDPINPQESGLVSIKYPHHVSVGGSYAYVSIYEADRYASRIEMVDISDADNPMVVGSFESPSIVTGIYASDGLLYLTMPRVGLQVLEVSDPTNPKEIGHYEGQVRYQGEGYVSMDIAGDYAYVAAGIQGLRVLDVANPADPQEIGSYPIAGGYPYQSVVESGGYAYLACDNAGFGIMDVSNPTKPRMVGFWNGSRPEGGYDTDFRLGDTALYGDYAYINDAFGGVYILDISDPSNPKKGRYFSLEPPVQSPYISGNHLYLVSAYQRLLIFDVSEPTNPQEVGAYDMNGSGHWLENHFGDLDVRDSYVYLTAVIAGQYSLLILDVSDVSHPRKVGEYISTREMNYINAVGNYAYVEMDDVSLLVIDVTEKQTPELIATLPLPEEVHVFGMHVSDGYVYLCESYSTDPGISSSSRHYRVRVIDISNPRHPLQAGECQIDGPGGELFGFNRITVSQDKYIYLTLGVTGFYILKFTPTTRVSVTSPESGIPDRFSLQQNYPNPFNSETTITYQLPQAGKVNLNVYNLLGQVVRTLVEGHQKPGSHSARWDGRDDRGRELPSGVYLYRLLATSTSRAPFIHTKKMLLLK